MLLVHELSPLHDPMTLGALVAQYRFGLLFRFFIFDLSEIIALLKSRNRRPVRNLYWLTIGKRAPEKTGVSTFVDELHFFIFSRYFV